MKRMIPIYGDGRPMPNAMAPVSQERAQGIAGHPRWPRQLDEQLERIAAAGLSRKATHERFRDVAAQMNEAIAPNSACSGRGCSACCSISVVISDVEAEALGDKLGIQPRRKVAQERREDVVDAWFGVPCTFLKQGLCSIYDVRPIACLLNHSLGPDASMCSTDVKPEDSCVPRLNLIGFWVQYIQAMKHKGWSDIRSFFPSEVVATMRRKRA